MLSCETDEDVTLAVEVLTSKPVRVQVGASEQIEEGQTDTDTDSDQ